MNLDYAASTPVMADVWEAVEAFVPWYSSVHRGTGFKSQVATDAFEDARADVARSSARAERRRRLRAQHHRGDQRARGGAAGRHAGALTPVEHHANMLPWRQHDVTLLPFTRSTGGLLEAAEQALRARRYDLLAVTGASNVTGEVWPIAELARARPSLRREDLRRRRPAGAPPADRHGGERGRPARVLRPQAVRAARRGRAGRPHAADGEPLLHGGGAIKLVTVDDVVWADAPERFEAGSPNVLGVVALAAACRALRAVGMDAVAEHERRLATRLWSGLLDVPGLRTLRLWPDAADRVGVAAFTVEGWRDEELAAALSDRYAIGVRHGCFCAHPLMTRLLGVPDTVAERLYAELRAGGSPELPGAVRASIGLGTTAADIDLLIGALYETTLTTHHTTHGVAYG